MFPNALTIAGSDSGGGAGIQADLKTFAALDVYGASVVTAVTAQNTRAVTAIHAIPPKVIAAQLDAVFDDIDFGAVKVGMLGDASTIQTVAHALRAHGSTVVLDPVMVAKSGDRLLEASAVAALKNELLGLARVITPNLPELADLLGGPVPKDESEMVAAGRALLSVGANAVLVKGGHAEGPDCVDLLVTAADVRRFEAPRTETANTHGTGCTLSSAIAARLAHGDVLAAAVDAAKSYVSQAIGAGDALSVGSGYGPVHHFWRQWGPKHTHSA